MSMGSEHVDQMSTGEFARGWRLSAKALRLYDELGLLPPARVDEGSGFRFYEPGQLKQARLIAALRPLQVPLAEIEAVLPLGADWQVVSRSLEAWGELQHDDLRLATGLADLGLRTTFVPSELDQGTYTDFAVAFNAQPRG